jgi:hypothetical protein
MLNRQRISCCCYCLPQSGIVFQLLQLVIDCRYRLRYGYTGSPVLFTFSVLDWLFSSLAHSLSQGQDSEEKGSFRKKLAAGTPATPFTRFLLSSSPSSPSARTRHASLPTGGLVAPGTHGTWSPCFCSDHPMICDFAARVPQIPDIAQQPVHNHHHRRAGSDTQVQRFVGKACRKVILIACYFEADRHGKELTGTRRDACPDQTPLCPRI